MPLYYLHLRNSTGLVRDEEGHDLRDLDAARRAAVASIRSIIADEALQGRIDLRGEVEIADGADAVLLRVAFAEAFTLGTPGGRDD